MKKIFVLLAALLMLSFSGCNAANRYTYRESSTLISESSVELSDSSEAEEEESEPESLPEEPEESSEEAESSSSAASNDGSSGAEAESNSEETEENTVMEQNVFYVTVGGSTFTASFADNTGANALRELLANGPITIDMSDYGSFEKVGSLGQSLPTSNSQTTTQAGDIVLYQGNQIVIFYGSNSWSYTRLGRIQSLSGWEEALGSGNVSVTFSLTNPQG